MVTLATAHTPAEVSSALLKLTNVVSLHQDPKVTLRSFCRFALVGVGPQSASKWRQAGSTSAPGHTIISRCS